MPFMHHAAPGAMLLTAPELRPEKHLGAGSAVKVSMGVPEIWPLLVVVRGNCSLVSGKASQHLGMRKHATITAYYQLTSTHCVRYPES